MPCLTVKIVYDRPVDDPYWLNEDNVSIALQAYCKNTKFEVTTVVPWALCEGEEPQADELTELIKSALSELGVPNASYPAPVANAVRILEEALHLQTCEIEEAS